MANEIDQQLYRVSQYHNNSADGQPWVYFYCLANNPDEALDIALEECDEEGDIFDRFAIVECVTLCSMAKHTDRYLASPDALDALTGWRKDNSDGGTLDMFGDDMPDTRPTLPGDHERAQDAIARAGAIRTTAGGEAI